LITLNRQQALGYRLRINNLVGPRLLRTALADAAHSGLQDGSPRSGLLSLAARVDDVEPDDWQHPDLVQVFGPRGAVYLVLRQDAS
jgi:hypothetical protein